MPTLGRLRERRRRVAIQQDIDGVIFINKGF
jgi:hypothetical protein